MSAPSPSVEPLADATPVVLRAPVVLFDLDDTLVDFSGAARRALADATAPIRARRALPEGAADDAWQAVNDHEYGRFLSGELTFEGMRVARMAAVLSRLDPEGASSYDAAALETARNDAIFGHYRCFDDVADVLHRAAAAGTRVGLISNSDGDYQRRKLRTVGLDHLIDHSVFSGDVGVSKPDPAIFERGAAHLGVTPVEAVYVGDRWFTDVIGAARAGMSSVWLNRAGAAPPDAPTAQEDGPMAGEIPATVLGQARSLDDLRFDPTA